MNEKSKIIKILQKRNLTEEDNCELRILLNKLSRKKLFSLLGRDFENNSINQDLQSEIDNKKEEIKKRIIHRFEEEISKQSSYKRKI